MDRQRLIYQFGNLLILGWFCVRQIQTNDTRFMHFWLLAIAATFGWFVVWIAIQVVIIGIDVYRERTQ